MEERDVVQVVIKVRLIKVAWIDPLYPRHRVNLCLLPEVLPSPTCGLGILPGHIFSVSKINRLIVERVVDVVAREDAVGILQAP